MPMTRGQPLQPSVSRAYGGLPQKVRAQPVSLSFERPKSERRQCRACERIVSGEREL